MTIHTATAEATVHSAYNRGIDQQIAEGLKQARDPNVEKFSIADIDASTDAIVRHVHAVREQQWHLYGEDTQAWFVALQLSQARSVQA